MSDIKFHCPRCDQKIQCDDQWAGQKMQCPSCHGELAVPVPAPPPSATAEPAAAPRLSISRPQSPAPNPALPGTSPRALPHPGLYRKAKGKNTGKIVKVTVLSIVALVGCFVGFKLFSSWQRDFNKKSDEAAKRSDGGEVGHIAELHAVLDATDPSRYGRVPAPEVPSVDLQAMRMARTAAAAGGPQANPDKDLPIVPAVWTLDVNSGKIPDGRVNGKISGTAFVADAAILSKTSQSYALSLRQGTGASADREVVLYIKVNAGETLFGRSWNIEPSMTSARTPQVVKRWKPDPRYAAKQKNFRSGYAMKLELGQAKDGFVPGKIFLALPDEEKSVVAGVFHIPIVTTSLGENF